MSENLPEHGGSILAPIAVQVNSFICRSLKFGLDLTYKIGFFWTHSINVCTLSGVQMYCLIALIDVFDI